MTSEWWRDYTAYLLSPEWEEFRLRALSFHGRRCNHCHREPEQLGPGEWLEVDHLNYLRVGAELLSDVQILCNTCHRAKTLRARRWRKVKRLFRSPGRV